MDVPDRNLSRRTELRWFPSSEATACAAETVVLFAKAVLAGCPGDQAESMVVQEMTPVVSYSSSNRSKIRLAVCRCLRGASRSSRSQPSITGLKGSRPEAWPALLSRLLPRGVHRGSDGAEADAVLTLHGVVRQPCPGTTPDRRVQVYTGLWRLDDVIVWRQLRDARTRFCSIFRRRDHRVPSRCLLGRCHGWRRGKTVIAAATPMAAAAIKAVAGQPNQSAVAAPKAVPRLPPAK